jgi:four helix bundle protein
MVRIFEDLRVWQASRALALEIYRITGTGRFSRDFGLSRQSQTAAVSVMSNIAEGFERSSQKDFQRFLTIARGSAAEVRSQLYLAQDLAYLSESDAGSLRRECFRISSMIGRLRARTGRL